MSEELDEYTINYEHFMNKSTFLYGSSDTGKTTIIFDILHHLSRFIDQIIVVSPSDSQTGDYSKVIPSPLVHYSLTKELIEDILERQEMLTQVQVEANNLSILESLFNKLQLEYENKLIDSIRQKTKESIKDVETNYTDQNERLTQIKIIEAKCDEFCKHVYKKYVNLHMNKFSILDLSEKEKFSLKFHNLNPRLILVLEDCGAQIKTLRTKTKALDEILFRGRHANITLLLPCQDDKNVDSELRKNAFINIFTTDICANSYFERQCNNFNKDTRCKVKRYASTVFKVPFQKLIYIRKLATFYRYTAVMHSKLNICSPIIREFCDKIEKKGVKVNKGNKFYSYFNSNQ